MATPRLQQCAVDTEMLGGEQATSTGLLHDIFEEGPGDVALQQPVPILGEGGRCPHRVVHGQTDKPAIQQVVFRHREAATVADHRPAGGAALHGRVRADGGHSAAMRLWRLD
jgi:hypothetical protein